MPGDDTESTTPAGSGAARAAKPAPATDGAAPAADAGATGDAGATVDAELEPVAGDGPRTDARDRLRELNERLRAEREAAGKRREQEQRRRR